MSPISTTARLRGERGHAERTFLRRLTMVCLVVLVFSGLVVHWVGETTQPPHTADHPPAIGPPHPSDDKARDGHQQARAREGGVDCDDRA